MDQDYWFSLSCYFIVEFGAVHLSVAFLYLVKFPKGVADKIHSHPEATQITIGLSGMVKMSPEADPMKVEPNMVVTAGKGGKHGATDFTEESIVLFFWDGSPIPLVHE